MLSGGFIYDANTMRLRVGSRLEKQAEVHFTDEVRLHYLNFVHGQQLHNQKRYKCVRSY